MEPNNKWVDDRLAKLNPDDNWEPRTAAALSRFNAERQREPSGVRWSRLLTVAAFIGLCVLTFPQPRAAAQRVIAPCVEACENLVSHPEDLHAHLNHVFVAFHNFLGITPPSVIATSYRQPAPDFQVTDATGQTFRLSDYKGKVVVLTFWATWCAPCREEIPYLIALQRSRGNQGFAVIAVSLDEDGWKSVRPMLDSAKINYRVGIGDDALAKKYGGVESLPETLLIDRQGRIASKHIGISKLQRALEIDTVLGPTE